jgi:7-keto-8-aminopelargonate synthetase-like enzyme
MTTGSYHAFLLCTTNLTDNLINNIRKFMITTALCFLASVCFDLMAIHREPALNITYDY